MSVTIRKMTTADIGAVALIDQMSFSLPWPESSYRFEVGDNRAAQCLVAETVDRRIAAMIVSWLVVDELHIATFATHPDFRRQGVGSLLLQASLEQAARLGARRAFLEVREGNAAAQDLYRKFGFRVTGRRPHYYRDDGEDAILMSLDQLEPA